MMENGSPAHAGLRLRRWAERNCSPDVMEVLILPMIADLQYEDTCSHSTTGRWSHRLRSYVGIFKALALYFFTERAKTMQESKWSLVRLALMVPAALAASLAVQYVVFQTFGVILYWLGGVAYVTSPWLGKTLTTPFIGASFVIVMWSIAPTSRKRLVSATAFAIVMLWGGLLVFGSVFPWRGFHGWLLAMGLSGWLGGTLAFFISRRVRPTAS
jgi:hypothetical protein